MLFDNRTGGSIVELRSVQTLYWRHDARHNTAANVTAVANPTTSQLPACRFWASPYGVPLRFGTSLPLWAGPATGSAPLWDIPALLGLFTPPFPCSLGHPCRFGTFLRGAAAGMSRRGRIVPKRRRMAPVQPHATSNHPAEPAPRARHGHGHRTGTRGRRRHRHGYGQSRGPGSGPGTGTKRSPQQANPYPNTGSPARTSRQFSSANSAGSITWFATT